MSSLDASTATVFARYPAALSLPTADPNALAVEAMLRFADVRYSRTDAPLRSLSLTIPPAASSAAAEGSGTSAARGGKPEVCAGLLPCLKRIGTESTLDAVPSTHTTTAVCVEVLTVNCLFPAFVFITHYDPVLYAAVLRKKTESKLGSFWERIRGTYREHVLAANPLIFSGTLAVEIPQKKLSLAALSKLREVGEDAYRAFASLESLLTSTNTASTTEEGVFFLGTTRPTYVDALVYAAASSFMHSDLREASASVRDYQRRVQESCPGLLQYVERMRRHFFEADGGTYNLKPQEMVGEEDSDAVLSSELERHYRNGRLQTLWWTVSFASLYFVLVNADVLLALLETAQEEEDEGNSATEEDV